MHPLGTVQTRSSPHIEHSREKAYARVRCNQYMARAVIGLNHITAPSSTLADGSLSQHSCFQFLLVVRSPSWLCHKAGLQITQVTGLGKHMGRCVGERELSDMSARSLRTTRWCSHTHQMYRIHLDYDSHNSPAVTQRTTTVRALTRCGPQGSATRRRCSASIGGAKNKHTRH